MSVTPLAERPHTLYRFFAEDGALLYVGITADLPARFGRHRDGKPWWSTVANITVEHFEDRRSVLAAEKAAIEAERPLYNTQHNGGHRTDVNTLIELSRDVLLILPDDEFGHLMAESPAEPGSTHELVWGARAASSLLRRQLRQFAAVTQGLLDHLPIDRYCKLMESATERLTSADGAPPSGNELLIEVAYRALAESRPHSTERTHV